MGKNSKISDVTLHEQDERRRERAMFFFKSQPLARNMMKKVVRISLK